MGMTETDPEKTSCGRDEGDGNDFSCSKENLEEIILGDEDYG